MANDFGKKASGRHSAKSLAGPLLQTRRIVTQGRSAIDAFPAAPEMSSKMTINKAKSFANIRGLRTKSGKLFAVVKRKDRKELIEEKVMLSEGKLCILVFDSETSRNHLIWLE
ncbi:hypothetical protein HN803_01430 [candidate division WWE3 bacterium]|jgi:hypothetical protein|nr:hypothetical protein [candidate division WWE3 bacterium]MBT7349431.1 hypothetical protein [candidate division WWE3 bacterium]